MSVSGSATMTFGGDEKATRVVGIIDAVAFSASGDVNDFTVTYTVS